MKKLLLILSLFIFGNAQAQEIALCNGKYALCAASTCKTTGKTITTNDGQVKYSIHKKQVTLYKNQRVQLEPLFNHVLES